MTADTTNNILPPLDLSDVLTDELRRTRQVEFKSDELAEVFEKLHEQELTALCFSGGGIRSATFGLGIVQALAKHGLLEKFDYLSTVSGGGYLGSWLSAWVYRVGGAGRDDGIRKVQETINCQPIEGGEEPNPEPTQLQHLREYSNYMSPRRGLMSADTWTLIAIYLRNFFLNLTIFVPLIAAILMLPRFLFLSVKIHGVEPWIEMLTVGGAIVAGAWSIAFVVGKLPGRESSEEVPLNPKSEKAKKPFANTDAGVLIFGVLPLVFSAFAAASVWAWNYRYGSAFDDTILLGINLGPNAHSSLPYFLLASLAGFAVGAVVFFFTKGRRTFDWWSSVSALLSGLLGGGLLWLSVHAFVAMSRPNDFVATYLNGYISQIYICLSVPIFLLIVLIAATIFVGLSSRGVTDEDREWLARYGAWVLIVGVVWMGLSALVLLAPSLLEWVFRLRVGGDTWDRIYDAAPAVLSTLAAILSGIIALAGGFSEKSLVRHEPVKSRSSKILSLAPQVAAVIFLGFLLGGIAYLTTLLVHAVGAAPLLQGLAVDHINVLHASVPLLTAAIFAGLSAVGVFMACFVNVNKFSLHGAYRDRLVRAYLGASNPRRDQNTFTGFDGGDNVEFFKLEDQRPLHVINAAVNLVGGKNLAWQNRKAASFTMSSLHCGSWAVGGYRHSKEYCLSASSGKALRLGTAMAISGAAANPNMGYYSSPVVTFLMALFNIRLGWWLGNPGKVGSSKDWFGFGKRYFFQKSSPSIAVLPLLNETLGRTDEEKRFLNVTDGGHFENLALYEMVLRRCRIIFLSDGAADASFKFGEIANAIQKCKVDLGVDIQFVGGMNILPRSNEEEATIKRSRFAIAKITYPERDADGRNRVGFLLYMRPTYYGTTEPRDIRYYADSNATFPHQSTGDQMYDEKQFEAYRGLGFLTMEEVVGEALHPPMELVDVIKDELTAMAKKDMEDGKDELAEIVGNFLGIDLLNAAQPNGGGEEGRDEK